MRGVNIEQEDAEHAIRDHRGDTIMQEVVRKTELMVWKPRWEFERRIGKKAKSIVKQSTTSPNSKETDDWVVGEKRMRNATPSPDVDIVSDNGF
ncbi:hypothetical protein Ancab_014117 [Ancistrocladus abbreviatus]